MKAYVATVQLLIVSDSQAEAIDAVSNILSSYEMTDGTLKDWAYIMQIDSKGNEYFEAPIEVGVPDNYKEGDFLHA